MQFNQSFLTRQFYMINTFSLGLYSDIIIDKCTYSVYKAHKKGKWKLTCACVMLENQQGLFLHLTQACLNIHNNHWSLFLCA